MRPRKLRPCGRARTRSGRGPGRVEDGPDVRPAPLPVGADSCRNVVRPVLAGVAEVLLGPLQERVEEPLPVEPLLYRPGCPLADRVVVALGIRVRVELSGIAEAPRGVERSAHGRVPGLLLGRR